jgi:hypothetical protein
MRSAPWLDWLDRLSRRQEPTPNENIPIELDLRRHQRRFVQNIPTRPRFHQRQSIIQALALSLTMSTMTVAPKDTEPHTTRGNTHPASEQFPMSSQSASRQFVRTRIKRTSSRQTISLQSFSFVTRTHQDFRTLFALLALSALPGTTATAAGRDTPTSIAVCAK